MSAINSSTIAALLNGSGASGSGASALFDAVVSPTLTAEPLSAGFGPAAIVSLGEQNGTIDQTYSGLAGTLSTVYGGSQSAPQIPTSKAELAALNSAFSLIENSQFDDAESALNDILANNPRSGAAVQALGLIALAKDDPNGAAKLFQRADFLSPGKGYDIDASNAEVLQQDDGAVLAQAKQLLNNKDTRDKGVELLFRLIDRSPNDAAAQLALGEGLLATKKVTEGITHILTAIDAGDDTLKQQIETEFEKLTTAAPKIPEYRGVLARVRIRLGKFDEALNDLDIADSLTEGGDFFRYDRVAANVGIGLEQLKSGDLDVAINTLRGAHTLSPTDPDAGAALAEALVEKGDRIADAGNVGKAIDSYDEAARMIGSGGSDSLRNHLAARAYSAGLRYEGQSHAVGRDLDKEVLAFQAAYTIDPENAAYKRKLADTRDTIGDQYTADKDYVSAAGAYQRAHDLYKNDPTYKANLINAWQSRGDELLHQHRFDEAITAYQNAYGVDTDNQGSKLKLAAAFNARGVDYKSRSKFQKAALDFKEAVHYAPDNSDYQDNYSSVSSYDT